MKEKIKKEVMEENTIRWKETEWDWEKAIDLAIEKTTKMIFEKIEKEGIILQQNDVKPIWKKIKKEFGIE